MYSVNFFVADVLQMVYIIQLKNKSKDKDADKDKDGDRDRDIL